MPETVRVNITVPVELHDRLQAVKDRINVSAVCSEAIENEVRIQEALNISEDKKQAAIARLKAERAKANSEWYQEGREWIVDLLEDFSLEVFLAVESHYQDGGDEDVEDFFLYEQFEDLRQMLADWETENLRFGYFDRNCPAQFRKLFLQGMFDAIWEYWKEIRGEVMSDK